MKTRTPRPPKCFPVGYAPARPVLGEYGAERQRFPYWKVQTWNATTLCWQDVQAQHFDKGAAETAGRATGRRSRLMQVEEKKRFPLPEL